MIPAGVWQAGELVPGGAWALFGCTMAPGFTAASFEGGTVADLLASYPEREEDIRRLGIPGRGRHRDAVRGGELKARLSAGCSTGSLTGTCRWDACMLLRVGDGGQSPLPSPFPTR